MAKRKKCDTSAVLPEIPWSRKVAEDKEKYQRYLCSREWSEKREAVRKRAYGRCERCRVLPMEACHHLTYARKYNEHLDDLQAICNACHEFTHGKSDFDPCANHDWLALISWVPRKPEFLSDIDQIAYLMLEFPRTLFSVGKSDPFKAMRSAWDDFSAESAHVEAIKWFCHRFPGGQSKDGIDRRYIAAAEALQNQDECLGVFTLTTLFYKWFDFNCPKPAKGDKWLKYWGWETHG